MRLAAYLGRLAGQWLSYSWHTRRFALVALLLLGPIVALVFVVAHFAAPVVLYPFL